MGPNKRQIIWIFNFILLGLIGSQAIMAEATEPKYHQVSGRILNLQINPVVLPKCLVTCSYNDGVGDDDIFTVPLCHSNKTNKCDSASAELTPAVQMEVWLEPTESTEAKKLVLITTHNLYLPSMMNTSTRYIELNLPNLVTSIADMEFKHKDIQSRFITVTEPDLGEVIVGVEMLPKKTIASETNLNKVSSITPK